jgi:hypothetical protein
MFDPSAQVSLSVSGGHEHVYIRAVYNNIVRVVILRYHGNFSTKYLCTETRNQR